VIYRPLFSSPFPNTLWCDSCSPWNFPRFPCFLLKHVWMWEIPCCDLSANGNLSWRISNFEFWYKHKGERMRVLTYLLFAFSRFLWVHLMWIWFVFSVDWKLRRKTCTSTRYFNWALLEDICIFIQLELSLQVRNFTYNSLVRLLLVSWSNTKYGNCTLPQLWHCLSLCLSLCCCGFVTCRINLSAFSHYEYECECECKCECEFEYSISVRIPCPALWAATWTSWQRGTVLGVQLSMLCCCPKLNRLVDGPLACQFGCQHFTQKFCIYKYLWIY